MATDRPFTASTRRTTAIMITERRYRQLPSVTLLLPVSPVCFARGNPKAQNRHVIAEPQDDTAPTNEVRRDRDAGGRPRNARPRDALGRPLPRGAAGVPTTDESITLTPEQALAEAQRLLVAGRPFHAHEVLEGAWKAAAEPERELWRGLAQLAVGLTHAHRGNAGGASRLLRRAADRIAPYAAAPHATSAPHGVPVAALAQWAWALATRIELDGLSHLTQQDLLPHLRA